MDETEPSDEALTLEDITRQQALIGAAVQKVSKTVNQIAYGGAAAKKKPLPEFTAADLVEWVNWLTARYELGPVIPECWPRHGALVEEFAALYVAWIDTLDQGGTTGAVWHDQLGRTLERIDGRWRTCIDGEHRPRQPAHWLENGPSGADELQGSGRTHPVTDY